jgi:hypothetical protein
MVNTIARPGRMAEGVVAEDRDFAKWVAIHRNWRRRLSDYIQGIGVESLDEGVVCRGDCCELGKWIAGSGERIYGRLPAFGKLRDHHAEFHRCAGRLVDTCKRNGREAATKALHTEFDLASLKVIESLEALERVVKGLPW